MSKAKKEFESLKMLRKLPITEIDSIRRYTKYIHDVKKMCPNDHINRAVKEVFGRDPRIDYCHLDFQRFEKYIFNPLTIIASINDDGIIGINSGLAYHIKTDTTFFREMTTGKIVVMGRRTFDTLGKVPLKNRLNVVVTRQSANLIIPKEYQSEVLVVHDLFDVVFRPRFLKLMLQKFGRIYDDSDTMLIGGAELYKDALERDYVQNVIFTHIKDSDDNLKRSGLKFPHLEWILTKTRFYKDTSLGYSDYTDSKPLEFNFYQRTREDGDGLVRPKFPKLVTDLLLKKEFTQDQLARLEFLEREDVEPDNTDIESEEYVKWD